MNSRVTMIWDLLRETYEEWSQDQAPRLAASLAYYTLFALAPLLVIVTAIAGLVFGQEASTGQLFGQIEGMVGKEGAAAIQQMVASANKPVEGTFAAILGVITLLLAAAGLFGELQYALNTIWGVRAKPQGGIMNMIRQRFFSFSMVLGTGFLLLVSLVISSVLAALSTYFQNLVPGFDVLWQILNFVISFLVTSVLFMLMYKVIPDVEVAWRDVAIGAIVTALLFSIGRFAIAFYLGRGSYGSTFGTAASLVIVLVWIYLSAQILFFGAEFTQVYARMRGAEIRPSDHAEAIGLCEDTPSAKPKVVMQSADAKAQLEERRAKEAEPPLPAGSTPYVGTLGIVVGVVFGFLAGRRR